ncbi:hypothetical protein FLK61_27915 [Paenalkalicoccus suaedae]|uniref:Antiporter n=1 Tax=Paenalkalicoccus suaedae TaxID=2592382 RepID=A0A859FCB0_9BACI|nr:VLRF1 family aeRF1-type release factor [Paenalkalicoccus suaedae]QKS70580.1 hypothetical protein FLK61_27915 [Paenalkalicoccus suaedae]
MTLTEEIHKLRELECSEGKCVLSVYLNTDPANPDQQKGEWKIRLKNGLKRLEEYIEASGETEELKSYKKLRKKVDDEINGNRTNLTKSVVIFASDEEDLWSVHYLPIAVETDFQWEKTAQVDQLEMLEKHYPLAGIVLPNMDEVKIIETSLGEINNEWTYTFDSGKEEWSLSDGMASGDRIASGATHVDKFQQRFEENLQRFYKEMATKVENLKKKQNWEEIHLVGEAEMVRNFESGLRKEVASRVEKNLNKASATKVLDEVFS